jgi:hypothetical protein
MIRWYLAVYQLRNSRVAHLANVGYLVIILARSSVEKNVQENAAMCCLEPVLKGIASRSSKLLIK